MKPRQKNCLPNRLLHLIPFIAGLTMCAHARKAPSPQIAGSFLQLWQHHLAWGEQEWEELFGYFARLELKTVVIQWSALDTITFFRPTDAQVDAQAKATLATILGHASQHQIDVWLGLLHDQGNWQQVLNGDLTARQRHLDDHRQRVLKIAEELVQLHGNHPSVVGWYLTDEIDDVHWLQPRYRQTLATHLGDLTQELRRLAPDLKIAISGFSNGETCDQSLGLFWQELLQPTSIDALLFQDSIGVRKLTLEKLPTCLQTVRQGVRNAGRELVIIVEIFRQTDGHPINGAPFRAVPASLERIQAQLHLAQLYSDAGIIAFSVPEYMTPIGGEAAAALFRQYHQHIAASSRWPTGCSCGHLKPYPIVK